MSRFEGGTLALSVAVVNRLSSLIDACAERGYVAFEFDNLKSYTRSDGVLTGEESLSRSRCPTV